MADPPLPPVRPQPPTINTRSLVIPPFGRSGKSDKKADNNTPTRVTISPLYNYSSKVKAFTVDADPEETIQQLIAKHSDKMGLPACMLSLAPSGQRASSAPMKTFSSKDTVRKAGIKTGQYLHCVPYGDQSNELTYIVYLKNQNIFFSISPTDVTNRWDTCRCDYLFFQSPKPKQDPFIKGLKSQLRAEGHLPAPIPVPKIPNCSENKNEKEEKIENKEKIEKLEKKEKIEQKNEKKGKKEKSNKEPKQKNEIPKDFETTEYLFNSISNSFNIPKKKLKIYYYENQKKNILNQENSKEKITPTYTRGGPIKKYFRIPQVILFHESVRLLSICRLFHSNAFLEIFSFDIWKLIFLEILPKSFGNQNCFFKKEFYNFCFKLTEKNIFLDTEEKRIEFCQKTSFHPFCDHCNIFKKKETGFYICEVLED